MARACFGEQEAGKRGRELASYLGRRMQERDGAGKDEAVVIYISKQESSKDANHYNETFIMAALLYLLFRFKFLKVSLVASAVPPPKVKRNEFQLKVSITERLDNRLSNSFYESIEELMRESYM